ncbi:AbrB family transcriptional regulator [Zhihengliuella halotolerans]|uniref:AbrB family transcriptional regulator n=1 Tax=Zhihengliuella halotolerans TaxID=370736 RepID=UPI00102B4DD4|nr:AbrB family transcriptional regulator [Zhihengliuella halotolerans]
MPERSSGADEPSCGQRILDAAILLGGGLAGGSLLALLQVPAGALIGAVLGAMAVNRLADVVVRRSQARSSPESGRRRQRQLPAMVRIVGQILLGVLAGAQLDGETLGLLLRALGPVIAAVLVMLGCSVLLARYLVCRHHVDPLTAVMAVAPGGISELAVAAQRQGARMHVVLAIHMFRVLVVVLVVLPFLLFITGG